MFGILAFVVLKAAFHVWQERLQQIEIHRRDQIVLEPRLAAGAVSLFVLAPAGQDNQRDMLPGRVLAHAPGRLITIHPRHA
jgi:hypothetical protein